MTTTGTPSAPWLHGSGADAGPLLGDDPAPDVYAYRHAVAADPVAAFRRDAAALHERRSRSSRVAGKLRAGLADLEIGIPRRWRRARSTLFHREDFATDLENVLSIRARSGPALLFLCAGSPAGFARPIHAALAIVLVLGLPLVAALSGRAVQHARLAQRLEVDELWKEVRWMALGRADDEVLRLTSEILRLEPNHVPALRARAVVHRGLANAETNPEKRRLLQEQTLVELSKLAELQPDRSWPHNLRALILQDFGREDEAHRAEERAELLRADPPAEDDLTFAAFMAQERGAHQEAVDLYTALIARRPNTPDSYRSRGESFIELGSLERAAEDCGWPPPWRCRLLPSLSALRVLLRGVAVDADSTSASARARAEQRAAAADAQIMFISRRAQGEVDGGREQADRTSRRRRARTRVLDLDPDRACSHVNLGASSGGTAISLPRPWLVEEARSTTGGARIWRASRRR